MNPGGEAPPHPDPTEWAHRLGDGAAGIALLHIDNALGGTDDWSIVHRWATTMTRQPITAHPEVCGLYRGAPAVAFALHAAQQPAYTTALNTLDQHITEITRQRLAKAHHRIDRGRLPTLREFDLIRGLTGIGVYLLYRRADGELLRAVLHYLTRLTQPLNIGREQLPGWWCSEEPSSRPPTRWPGGHGNLGMAHGIAGPLTLLSTAMRRGFTVDGQANAISRICEWLDRWRAGKRTPWWPAMISRQEQATGAVRQHHPARPSWCYGTPGLARAQQLAGLALADTRRQQLAEQALAGCLADQQQLSQLSDTSLCHGWAGLIQTTWRSAWDARDDKLAAHAPRLLKWMQQHLDQSGPPTGDGLLTGLTGVRLAQRTAASGAPPLSRWDACLLLDG